MTCGPERDEREDAYFRPETKPMPGYMDVPTCVGCGSRALVPAENYAKAKEPCTTDRDLLCAVCGWIVVGTIEQVAQAKRAEGAWNGRSDERRGPWLRVLRARAKRDRNQLRLFDAGRVRSAGESAK